MTTTAEQVRGYKWPTILSYGFRPFFLSGAAWAAIAVALWLGMLSGQIEIPTAFAPLQWHVHEMIYGYVPAVIAGFLLTAVPNWTGRRPVVGARLLALFALWFAGRLVILFSQVLGIGTAAVIDLAFLAGLGGVIGREIVASGDKRNLKVLGMIGLLFAGNAIFHFEAVSGWDTGLGTRVGVAAILLLIMVIGGRIIPNFTRNWLMRREQGRLPAAFDRLDMAAMAVSAIALALWVALPEHPVTAALAAMAALVNAWRLTRWAGERTWAEPLVSVLHAGFAFVPLGFALIALAIVRPDLVLQAGALHAWTAGAIGLMTLAVMTRASLGHTGQQLTATRPIQAIYVGVGLSALTRIAAAFDVMREPMLYASATLWVLAFTGFLIVYAPLLALPRRR
ncbi:MAG TPA: NnrS family protein [Hyphomicrobium sp.]|nr:NnrS family protein [Hyphomicrobium sp.]